MSDSKSYRSGELASLTGVSTDTLRHYERMGLLPKPRRSQGNYRLYPAGALERVRLIRHALSVGFSLPELAKILKVRDAGHLPCREVRGLLAEKISLLNDEIAQLQSARERLETVLQHWDQRLEQTPDGQAAKLLETFSASPSAPSSDPGEKHESRSRTNFRRNHRVQPRQAR